MKCISTLYIVSNDCRSIGYDILWMTGRKFHYTVRDTIAIFIRKRRILKILNTFLCSIHIHCHVQSKEYEIEILNPLLCSVNINQIWLKQILCINLIPF